MAYPRYSSPFGFELTPWIKRLLIANAVVFLLTWALPPLAGYLALVPAEILARPWTAITYMFVHGGFWHLFFNMLGLFFFGPVLEERWGSREFIKFYLICGVAGALLSFLTPHAHIVGASAAVYGIMVAYALYWPDNPIYIYGILPVKAKWLVGFLVAIAAFSTLSGSRDGTAHPAHFAGALAAFVYLKSPLAPSAWGATYPTGPRKRRRDWRSLLRRRRRLSVQNNEPPRAPGQQRPATRQYDDVDQILDKISAGGINSLTEEERRRLEEASRRFRSN